MSAKGDHEPLLRPEDVRAWDLWLRAARIHGRTQAHRHAVDGARRIASDALARGVRPSASVSGGKDSSALAILLGELGARVPVLSEKDGLDYPGEEDYVRALCLRAGLPLTILRPPLDPVVWLERRAGRMSGGEDQHGRRSSMARACFYEVMEAADRDHDVSFWGLRAEESGRRAALRAARGATYTLRSGLVRSAPLIDWRGLDVYAYLDERGVDTLPVYKCCGWLPEHRADPSRIRKSWWIPGTHAAQGQAAWLRHYWPSLYAQFRAWFPDAASYV